MELWYAGELRANVSVPEKHLFPDRDWKALWSVRGPDIPDLVVEDLEDGVVSPFLYADIVSADLQSIPLSKLNDPVTFEIGRAHV
jgi:hypothetical protein